MAEKKTTAVTDVKEMLGKETIKKNFADVLGKKAPQFTASIVNVVSANSMLKRCSAASIIGAAFVAATYDLPIDSNLGFAAIVPYNNRRKNPETNRWENYPEAQFQIMYKGFIQLAIRSGYYERMNYAVVYEDELKSYNPITGELKFVSDFSKCTQRDSGDESKVVGYYALFKLKTGFQQELFMTRRAVENHAKKYSQSYRKDLDDGKATSRWSVDFEAMALKTVIKMLLSKWGILSIDMQRAIQDDQKTFDDTGEASYGDNRRDAIEEAEDPFEQPAITAEPVQQPARQIESKVVPAEVQQPVRQQQKKETAEYEQYEQQYREADGYIDLSEVNDADLPFR